MQIIIAGVSRSGKSTLAREICKRLWFFFIPGDPLISALEELYPETGIHHCDDNRTFSPDLAVFIDRYLQHIAYEELDVVIDLYQLFPIDYQKVLRPHDILVVKWTFYINARFLHYMGVVTLLWQHLNAQVTPEQYGYQHLFPEDELQNNDGEYDTLHP